MKHTDGPWTAEPSVKGGYNIRDTDGNVPGIARTYGRYGAEEDEANARLIAACPDMYEALEEIAGCGGTQISMLMKERVRALLAKAKGE